MEPSGRDPKVFELEGRALVQFRLTKDRESYDMHLLDAQVMGSWPDGADARAAQVTRLHGASGVIGEVNSISFDPNDHTQLDPNSVYRVTVVFCLKPENCSRIPLYSHSSSLIIVAPPDDPVRPKYKTPDPIPVDAYGPPK
jgi:hypothetical protein